MIIVENHKTTRTFHAWRPSVILECLSLLKNSGYVLVINRVDNSQFGIGYQALIQKQESGFMIFDYYEIGPDSPAEIGVYENDIEALERFFLIVDKHYDAARERRENFSRA